MTASEAGRHVLAEVSGMPARIVRLAHEQGRQVVVAGPGGRPSSLTRFRHDVQRASLRLNRMVKISRSGDRAFTVEAKETG